MQLRYGEIDGVSATRLGQWLGHCLTHLEHLIECFHRLCGQFVLNHVEGALEKQAMDGRQSLSRDIHCREELCWGDLVVS